MRLFTLAPVALGAVLLLAACAGKSSNSTDNSAATTASAASPQASASAASTGAMNEATPGAMNAAGPTATAAGASSAAPQGPSNVPIYPGAVTQGSASYNGGAGSSGGSVQTAVMTTTDSFDKVYAFYQKNLPTAMEMMHTSTPPTPGAAFVVADPNDKGHATTVVIATGTDGKVTISIQTAQSNR
jgi:hypothetical protein